MYEPERNLVTGKMNAIYWLLKHFDRIPLFLLIGQCKINILIEQNIQNNQDDQNIQNNQNDQNNQNICFDHKFTII